MPPSASEEMRFSEDGQPCPRRAARRLTRLTVATRGASWRSWRCATRRSLDGARGSPCAVSTRRCSSLARLRSGRSATRSSRAETWASPPTSVVLLTDYAPEVQDLDEADHMLHAVESVNDKSGL